ncbi:class I SAM-dependent methyltransferase [Thermosipho atlanticus]|uniref:Methyltransferase domain-containing protein n=1 Tax=Thermosipho atlanticus DSM 15807 TaxID=1123380 RepID=A0A1M5RB53_9BACT|nr:class I SAM-dependent methyltransferase [Thermosipho atlanticus]SHH23340.1 Methyltransferase domain-containing protein [Thermosipho atlanticus DSM 15807]
MTVTTNEIKKFLKKLSFDETFINEFIEQINYFESEAEIRDNIVRGYLDEECIEAIIDEITNELSALNKNELTVLDVAAGSGFFTEKVKKKLEKNKIKIHLFALDITPGMLKNLQQNGISIVWGVAEKIKDSIKIFNEYYKTKIPEEFDAIFTTLAFHHFLEPEEVLTSMKKVLKKRGKIIIVDVLKHSYKELAETLKDTHLGFSCEEIKNMGIKLFEDVKVEPMKAYCKVDGKIINLYKAIFK